jgi:hypothetical protein
MSKWIFIGPRAADGYEVGQEVSAEYAAGHALQVREVGAKPAPAEKPHEESEE